ncbi:hypothetical protein C8F04DRAFT_1176591 [Mycena alexandri]|uniref:Ribonuclease H1 N-terminal domain-containing protein n=1 Tax=Mycena alexandri TaxID=1745969 RepID=A0AAD6XE46_9AGAR|nr:hypothetical protein C8F04DRAFT_1176591 [Mycena alexandri]
MSSLPSYQEALDAITTGLAHLSTQSPAATSPTPPAARPDQSARPSRLYQYSSPARSGLTADWQPRHTAAAATQGVSHGRPQLLTPTKSRSRRKKAAYVVFYGRRPGVYTTWAETEPLVKAVSGSLFQGYYSLDSAVAAFAYAQARSWTRVCPPPHHSRLPQSQSIRQPPIPLLPSPAADLDAPNPLHVDADGVGSRWYVVYAGITPGVYHSTAEATASFRSAAARGETQVLYPAYSTT